MATMYHRPSSPDGGHIFLATPSGNAPKPCYTYALGQTMRDPRFEHALYAGDCHVDDARNKMVEQFLSTDCTDLVFIDDDIGWELDDLTQLCEYDKDVVAATYPYKQDEEGYPVAFLPGERRAEDGVFEVAAVPTGFLRIKRHVLQIMADNAVKFTSKTEPDKLIPLIFERQVFGSARRGGDYAFCHKWRELGGKIYLDPEIILEHCGDYTWTGSWGHFNRCEMYGVIGAGLMEITAGVDTEHTVVDMVKDWDNKWSGDATLLAAAVILARQSTGPILEFGSGLTTLAMAAANPDIQITAVEHSDEWATRVITAAQQYGLTNITIHRAAIQNDFYAVDIREDHYEVVLCDGPPRKDGLRERMFDQPIGDATLLMDDLDCPVQSKRFIEWSDGKNRSASIVGRVGISRKAA